MKFSIYVFLVVVVDLVTDKKNFKNHRIKVRKIKSSRRDRKVTRLKVP